MSSWMKAIYLLHDQNLINMEWFSNEGEVLFVHCSYPPTFYFSDILYKEITQRGIKVRDGKMG